MLGLDTSRDSEKHRLSYILFSRETLLCFEVCNLLEDLAGGLATYRGSGFFVQ